MEPEYCNYGIRLEWSPDKRIAIISTEGDMSREAVDTWAELTIRTIGRFTPGQVGYLLFNMTGPKQGYTPYAAKRTLDVYRAIPTYARGYAAIVMRDTLLIRMMTALLRREIHLLRGGIVQKFFLDTDEAEGWLRERMAAQDNSASAI
jgi:hypothetical protein